MTSNNKVYKYTSFRIRFALYFCRISIRLKAELRRLLRWHLLYSTPRRVFTTSYHHDMLYFKFADDRSLTSGGKSIFLPEVTVKTNLKRIILIGYEEETLEKKKTAKYFMFDKAYAY